MVGTNGAYLQWGDGAGASETDAIIEHVDYCVPPRRSDRVLFGQETSVPHFMRVNLITVGLWNERRTYLSR